MLFGHPLCQSSKSLQTGRSGSEEFPRAAGDDEERGRDTGPLTPDRRCTEPAEQQTCPFNWTYIYTYLNTSFTSDLPQTKALPCGARVTSMYLQHISWPLIGVPASLQTAARETQRSADLYSSVSGARPRAQRHAPISFGASCASCTQSHMSERAKQRENVKFYQVASARHNHVARVLRAEPHALLGIFALAVLPEPRPVTSSAPPSTLQDPAHAPPDLRHDPSQRNTRVKPR
jgi:hypothetical protein